MQWANRQLQFNASTDISLRRILLANWAYIISTVWQFLGERVKDGFTSNLVPQTQLKPLEYHLHEVHRLCSTSFKCYQTVCEKPWAFICSVSWFITFFNGKRCFWAIPCISIVFYNTFRIHFIWYRFVSFCMYFVAMLKLEKINTRL